MSDRERKRAERRARKQKTTERQAAMRAKTDAKNEVAREALEPLDEGERPRMVTIAAIVSVFIVISIIVGYVTGATVNGEKPRFVQVLSPALVIGVMAYGLWRAKYWAVLGFQVVMLFLIFGAALGLVLAANTWQFLGRSGILIICSLGFYFMIRAMARIEMPKPPA